MRTINFSSSFVIDAWTESITKNNCEISFDYIKLCNGAMILVTDDAITIYDADDLEVPGSAVAFKNITTREK